jgi:hypothetical protein
VDSLISASLHWFILMSRENIMNHLAHVPWSGKQSSW